MHERRWPDDVGFLLRVSFLNTSAVLLVPCECTSLQCDIYTQCTIQFCARINKQNV